MQLDTTIEHIQLDNHTHLFGGRLWFGSRSVNVQFDINLAISVTAEGG